MRFTPRSRRFGVLASLVLAAAACGGGQEAAAPVRQPTDSPSHAPQEPRGTPLSTADITDLAAQFGDNPLTGGQTAPRLYRWVNDDVAIFLQFDNPDPAEATALRYIGVSVKGVFCAENQPGGEDGGFPHFHQLDAPEYGQGHGGPAGTPGYWLSWVAVDTFTAPDGRRVEPGVDYDFSPTPPPPSCGDDAPEPDFEGPGAGTPSNDELAELGELFSDQPLTGGQTAPRSYKWVNEDVAIFLQFDDPDPANATELPYVGISVKGDFCRSTQPTRDFPHFHRIHAAEYATGHGQEPNDRGYWLLWLAADSFTTRDGRDVTPGVDREFSPTPPPDC